LTVPRRLFSAFILASLTLKQETIKNAGRPEG